MADLCHFCRAAFYPVMDVECCSTQTAMGWARARRGKNLNLCGRVGGRWGIPRKPSENEALIRGRVKSSNVSPIPGIGPLLSLVGCSLLKVLEILGRS